MVARSDPSVRDKMDTMMNKHRRLFTGGTESPAQTIIITLLLMAAAFAASTLFAKFTDEQPIMIFAVAALTAILWRGLLGGIIATFITVVCLVYFFTMPRFSLSILDGGEVFSIILFAICALTLSWIEEKRRDARSERERLDTRLQALQELALSLSQALTPAQVARVILTRGIDALGASAGSVVVMDDDETTLEILATIGYDEKLVSQWMQFPVDHPYAPIAQCVREKRLVWYGSEYRAYSKDLTHKSWAAIPFVVDDEAIGGMGLSFAHETPFAPADREFAYALGNHCAQALQRALLTDRLKQSAANEERQRLARDLHDAVSQSLFASTNIAEALSRTWRENPESAEAYLDELVTLNRGALAEMRTLLLELRPDSITRYKLPDLLRQLLDAARSRRSIHAQFEMDTPDQPLPPETHVALYRIAQEAINNVMKHSDASQLVVSFTCRENSMNLIVRDNGKGFNQSDERGGLGMGTMRERAQSIGAALTVSSQPGTGTTVEVAWGRTH